MAPKTRLTLFLKTFFLVIPNAVFATIKIFAQIIKAFIPIIISFPVNVIVAIGILIIISTYVFSAPFAILVEIYAEIMRITFNIQIVAKNWIVFWSFQWYPPLHNDGMEIIVFILKMVWKTICNDPEDFAEIAECTGFFRFLMIIQWMFVSLWDTWTIIQYMMQLIVIAIVEIGGALLPRRSDAGAGGVGWPEQTRRSAGAGLANESNPWPGEARRFGKDSKDDYFQVNNDVCSNFFCSTGRGGVFDDMDDPIEHYKEGVLDDRGRRAVYMTMENAKALPTFFDQIQWRSNFDTYKQNFDGMDALLIQFTIRFLVELFNFFWNVVFPILQNLIAWYLDANRVLMVFYSDILTDIVKSLSWIIGIFRVWVIEPVYEIILNPDVTQFHQPDTWDPNERNFTITNDELDQLAEDFYLTPAANLSKNTFLDKVQFVPFLTVRLKFAVWIEIQILSIVNELPYALLILVDKIACLIIYFPGCFNFQDNVCTLIRPPNRCLMVIQEQLDPYSSGLDPQFYYSVNQTIYDQLDFMIRLKRSLPPLEADKCRRKTGLTGTVDYLSALGTVDYEEDLDFMFVSPNPIPGTDWDIGQCLINGTTNARIKRSLFEERGTYMGASSLTKCGTFYPFQQHACTFKNTHKLTFDDYFPGLETELKPGRRWCGDSIQVQYGGTLWPDFRDLVEKTGVSQFVEDLLIFLMGLVPTVSADEMIEFLTPLYYDMYDVCISLSTACPCTRCEIPTTQVVILAFEQLFSWVGLDSGVPCNPSQECCTLSPWLSIWYPLNYVIELISGLSLFNEEDIVITSRRDSAEYLLGSSSLPGDWATIPLNSLGVEF
jgi:hypothetical protein